MPAHLPTVPTLGHIGPPHHPVNPTQDQRLKAVSPVLIFRFSPDPREAAQCLEKELHALRKENVGPKLGKACMNLDHKT